MTIRALIVDDEPLARDCVRLALENEPDVELVGECGTGDGVQAGRGGREGVGLSNTRARLEQLYGADAGVTLGNAEGGGARATLWLPLRTRPEPGTTPRDAGGGPVFAAVSDR